MLGKVCEEKWLFSPKGKGNPNISGELFQPYMWTLGAGAELSTILTRSEKNIFYIIFFSKENRKIIPYSLHILVRATSPEIL